jgi:hypothetical protein
MFAKLAQIWTVGHGPWSRSGAISVPSNDNHPRRHLVVCAPPARRRALACHWHQTPRSTLECTWHAVNASEEPGISWLTARLQEWLDVVAPAWPPRQLAAT